MPRWECIQVYPGLCTCLYVQVLTETLARLAAGLYSYRRRKQEVKAKHVERGDRIKQRNTQNEGSAKREK
jgi:hypothetical protein